MRRFPSVLLRRALRVAVLALPFGTAALAQGSAPNLFIEPGDPGAETLGQGLAAAAGRLLGAGGEFASCLARVGGAEEATHRVVLRTWATEGAVEWTLEVVAEPSGEVVAQASGSGPEGDLAALGEAAAQEALAPLCKVSGGGGPTIYEASGGGAQITVTGTVEVLDKVFQLHGDFPGGTAEFTYTPVSAGGGAVEYALSGSGVTGSGEGIYSLTPQADGTVVLEQTTDGCVDGIPDSCRTNSETITLTPVAR